jgi:hypothetical protein
MSVEKLSVSFDASLVAAIRKSASVAKESISAWLADAAAAKERQLHLRAALDAFAVEHTALDEAQIEALIAKARKDSRISEPKAGRASQPSTAKSKTTSRSPKRTV